MLKKFIVGSLIFLTLTNVCYAESINDIKERFNFKDGDVLFILAVYII